MTIVQLLDVCKGAYEKSTIVGGPDNRDGAFISNLPTGECVLAFRGTLVKEGVSSILDWINDFVAILTHDDGFPGRIHKGFFDSLNNIWDDVISSLEDGGYKEGALPWDKKLIITGHSKGGALAILAGCRLAALKPTVVTFASPMTGDLAFEVDYPEDVSVVRYEGRDDLVPWLPPVGYRPVGAVISQLDEPWKARHSHIQRLMADLIDPLTSESTWSRIHKAHSLETGYRPWVKDEQVKFAA